ncbi:MAG: polysaccharide deacetylase family protein [bacterium]|nr:polysaccharide deacetylase family protein [bacterium]
MKPYGLMFHHFHDHQRHPEVQGSIDAETFEALLRFVGLDRIVPAQLWMERFLDGTLPEDALCLTFDDALRSQYDVAFPVLQKLGLTGFFFIYTSPLEGVVEKLEFYRYIRTTQYRTIDEFYQHFFEVCEASEYRELYEQGRKRFREEDWAIYPFYSYNDKLFRHIRDFALGQERYYEIMERIVAEHSLDYRTIYELLWLNRVTIEELHRAGNVIGLHTHTHPTDIRQMPYHQQFLEYNHNLHVLQTITQQTPVAMSHPNGRYNDDTLDILQRLKIRIGFRSDMQKLDSDHPYEISRYDHALLKRDYQQYKAVI